MNYIEFKKLKEEEANEFTKDKLFFALGFSEEEVRRKLKEEYNVEAEDVVGIGAGAYILKDSYNDVMKFFSKQAEEFKEFRLANIYDSLTYEFANHELEINIGYSYRSFLIEELDFTEEEIEANKEEILKAVNDYRIDFYKHN